MSTTAAASTSWSIFTEGGGPGAALTWAIDLLKGISAPLTPGNEQFVYDWETSEGGGGKFNPLNQGTDPGNPALTSTGNQYGGGAADYVSWSAGLQGAEDYLNMPAFTDIKASLQANDPVQARADLISSPWASSHYYGGSGFSTAAVPGKATALPNVSTSAPSSSSSGSSSILGSLTNLGNDFTTAAIVTPIVIGGAALVVWGFARMTGTKASTVPAAVERAGTEALAI